MKMTKLLAIGVALLMTLLGAAPAARAQVFIETQVAEPMMVPGLGMRGQGKTGTGKISGRVLSTETGAPLRRAQVRLTAPEVGVKTALTDTDGRFEFKDLPAGRFTVNASKSGHVSVQFGQSRPFESGRPIELADKQVLDKADIFMPRGGVISGRIVDEFGEPVTDAMVSTMRQTWLNGRRRIQTTGRIAQTNDLGQFRLYGLPPGEYLRQRDLAERRGDGDGHGARRSGSRSRLATDLRLRANLLPRHDHANQCAARHRDGRTGGTEHGLRSGAGAPRADQRQRHVIRG